NGCFKNGKPKKPIELSVTEFIQTNFRDFSYNKISMKRNVDSNTLSLSRGFIFESVDVEYNEERIKPILDFIFEIVCDNDRELFRYIMGWFYNLVYKPDIQPGSALFFYSGQGCGKGFIVNFIIKY